MIKLRYYGYREKAVELRELTVAELQLHIINRYIEKGIKEMRVIDISSGEIKIFHTVREVLECEWCGSAKLELVGLPHSWGTEDESYEVILIQQAEIDEDRVISKDIESTTAAALIRYEAAKEI